MKFSITVVFLLLITSCAAQKANNAMLDIRYEASTRGTSRVLQVKNDTIVYKNNEKEKTIVLTSEVRKEMEALLAQIAIEKMEHFKAPSKERAHDGALHAVLKIRKGAEEYVSTTFDDGNPPAELKALVDYLMEIVE